MEEEDHTPLEGTDQPKDDDDKQSKDIPDSSKRKSSRFAFDWDSDYSSRQKSEKAMRKLDLQHRMLELKHQWKLLRADNDSNSDDFALTEVAGERRKKSKAVYEKSPIKPERFPGKDFNRWELWVKHYKSVARANGWSDQQAIAALPACLTSWAVEEFETVPRKYIEKLPGELSPTFSHLLEVLKPKMQQYRRPRATRSGFKAVKQGENETLREYFRRVRYLGDLALSEKTIDERDKDLRDQFLDGLFDARLQQKLYEDEANRNFCEVLQRAQELELIQKNARDAELRREKPVRGEKVRYVADDADSDEVVRASFQSFPSQVEEKFVALQTSMSTVANRLDKLDHTIAKQGEANHQMMKALGENLTQGFNQMNNNLSQMPAAISAAMAASMGDLKAALVGAIGGAQSRGGGQFQQCVQQPSQPLQQQSNFTSRNNHMGHVSLSNPPPSRAECFECKEIGHFARECPRRIRSEHLNWAQLEPQQ